MKRTLMSCVAIVLLLAMVGCGGTSEAFTNYEEQLETLTYTYVGDGVSTLTDLSVSLLGISIKDFKSSDNWAEISEGYEYKTTLFGYTCGIVVEFEEDAASRIRYHFSGVDPLPSTLFVGALKDSIGTPATIGLNTKVSTESDVQVAVFLEDSFNYTYIWDYTPEDGAAVQVGFTFVQKEPGNANCMLSYT